MFTANIYRIVIASTGTILKEDRIAFETISGWTTKWAEKKGAVLLPILSEISDIVPDIYLFNIDNYIVPNKVESALSSGARVVLFFRQSHDSENTILGELRMVNCFKEKIRNLCSCYDYDNSLDYKEALIEFLNSLF